MTSLRALLSPSRRFTALLLSLLLGTAGALPAAETGSTGQAEPDGLDNAAPSTAYRWVIATTGGFPSRGDGTGTPSEEPYIGELRLVAFGASINGFTDANGALLSISQNTALFSLLGTLYGGDGRTNFALPDLRGRVPVGAGSGPGLSTYTYGQQAGSDTRTLTTLNLPSHTHTTSEDDTSATGGGQAFDHRQPRLALNFCVQTNGVAANIGRIRVFPFNFAPNGFLPADGSAVAIATYPSLFAKLGTTFGGDGTSTFGLPDLRGRTPIGLKSGTYALGDTGGTESVTLSTNQIAVHNHSLTTGISGATGGNDTYDNRDPFLVLNAQIALTGGFNSISDSPAIGEMSLWAHTSGLSSAWASATGSTLAIADNTTLYSLLGTIYGGNGQTTFNLPDTQGRTLAGSGTGTGLTARNLGDTWGAESNIVGLTQLPPHTHTYTPLNPTFTLADGTGNDTHGNGATISLVATFNKAVTITGTPRLVLTIGSETRYATYDAVQSDATTVVFTYNIQVGDQDPDGIAVASPLELDGGTISATTGGYDAILTFTPPDLSGVIVATNTAPTDLTLSANTLDNTAAANTVVGTLTAADADPGDTHTFTLVAGDGDTANASFNLNGAELRASDPSALTPGEYTVRIRATDTGGETYEESFTILVYDDTAISTVLEAYLKAPNAEEGDGFGFALAATDDTLAISAIADDSGANTIDGDSSDNSLAQAGSVFVFVRSGGAWSLQAYLKPDNPQLEGLFGTALVLENDTLVVGTSRHDTSVIESGAVYVFVRNGTTWSQQALLKAAHPDSYDQFGAIAAVDLSGDTLIVGVSSDDSNASGVDGDSSDNSLSGAGAAYVFVRNGTEWTQQAYLKASVPAQLDSFGISAAIDGDTAVVGASQRTVGANSNAGSAYVFTRSGTTWTEQTILEPQYPYDYGFYGYRVAIDGDTILVGSRGDSSSATGVNGNGAGGGADYSGAVYVYTRNGADWTQQAYLKASNAEANDFFGNGLALRGNLAVIGAIGEASATTMVNGDQSDNSLANAGAAYVFERTGTTWAQTGYLKAPNTGAGDQFGLTFAVNADTLFVGAYQEDSAATTINGDQSDDTAAGAGAVYSFQRTPNNAPTDLSLSAASVNQSAGTNAVIGTLSTTDADSADPHTYRLVAGDGDADNADFNLDGATLRATDAATLAAGAASVRIQTDDGKGGTFAASFTITVVDDVAPAAPSTPDLAADDDTGDDTDNLTFKTALTLAGTAEPGATLTLSRDGTPTGDTATADGSGNWSIDTTLPDADATYGFTVTATDAADNTSAASGSLAVTLDTTPPAFTGSATSTNEFGQATSLTLTTDETVTAFTGLNIPAGLTLNPATGAITGTATSAGVQSIIVGLTDTAGVGGSAVITLTVTPKPLTISAGFNSFIKTYDGTTAGPTDVLPASPVFDGLVSGFADVTLDGGALGTATYDSAATGTDKTVTITGLALAGADAANYTLNASTTTGTICARGLQLQAFTAADKVYDGTDLATVDLTGATLSGVVEGEEVSFDPTSATAFFGSTEKKAALPGQETGSVDALAFPSSSVDVGTDKPVYIQTLTLTGADAANYTFSIRQMSTVTADITPKPLTVTGITAANKTYDGLTTASVDTTNAALEGVVGVVTYANRDAISSPGSSGLATPALDDVQLDDSSAAATFADADAGTGKAITVADLTLTGTRAFNYTLTPPDLTADISPAPLTVSTITTGRNYGDPNPAFTATYTGFVNGEDESVLSGEPAFSTDATRASPIGNYVVTVELGTLSAANYTITTDDGLLYIFIGYHFADTDRNYRIDLSELLRVIELYNFREGTVRTGAYRSADDTEDGYAPGDGERIVPHTADSDGDGHISLVELTRVIQLYNYRVEDQRTGDYRPARSSEDGFEPGVFSSNDE